MAAYKCSNANELVVKVCVVCNGLMMCYPVDELCGECEENEANAAE